MPPLANIEDIPLLSDTTILENTLLEIDLRLNTQEWQIQWSPESIVECASCVIGNIQTDESTQVAIFLEHISGCLFETSFYLTIEKEPEHIFAPNIFTPNGGYNNNEWTFFTSPNIQIEACNIYDRWGNIVFSSTEDIPTWDGRSGNVKCVQGVYVYLIKYKDSEENTQIHSGNLTLIR
ncbi:MAG: T9SS type B sorting domain-containing protein [Saprospiraceae bacterium]|nr:gliding motility-associated C-terminal domain-containing protein [Bacteroidia bacterium]NNE15457.1 T9SS type B sorting domain-containing protein [Saprospiraceae bacterium]NNL91272.1 T9SS type B sorting domain-containing protein [Saprospiraceae bacterium]